MAVRRLLVVLSIVGLAGDVPAAEWHESYRAGLKALAQGQPMRAVSLLEQAAGQRPQPGRNVITYGTNVEERYYPYLHLAEAYLQLRDLPGARSALQRSEKWGREPAEERQRLAARVAELAARMAAPPVPAPTATAPPAVPRELPPETVAAPTAVPATPLPSAAATAAPPQPTDRGASRQRALPMPNALPAVPPSTRAQPVPVSGALEIVSQPPGASVYLDDEFIGTTDPEWGRLVRTGVPAGRHRVRLALAGHRDLVEDLEVGATGRTDLRRRLSPAAAATVDRRFVLFAGVALVLLALTAWALRRPGPVVLTPTPAAGRPFADTGPTPARPTPPGPATPGIRRDAQGHEYFGEYRLLEPLGRGGMASVYKAERRGEVYALKRPLPAFLEEPEFLERFLREAEIGRTLHHPNIVRILERGEVEGVPFFTMELVPGETLQAHLHRLGPMDPRAATRIVVQIAEALDYAHSKGVVHRDLKPSNVMVLADGTAKVMDYGIARARRFQGLTVTGSFLGSPEYVAPEAIEGRPTDGRSDLYSLGILFYEALTGRRPFTADAAFTLLRMHLTEPPPPPTSLRPGLSPELEGIILRLLAKTPERRHAAAEDLVLELRDFLNRAA
ncbi:MAG TPA: protein kinase [Vicinamibacteria bacterium]|jgi:serine/threonine-protein kinase|nr:protein kinase [Vicinamibacteria bacterium]